ncbi:extracellular solute-binding protein [Chelatococcus reniformis]|uniref:ABC transporter substrate-binding protein n=1 Tax=Chelatococcus reniformis TaxID=1494448 RepID=A0A916X9S3_9HYPH|nr:extracellular solute-binding protein [Chelatococcus reniformis]GGC55568.1 ABC transporter substrate-binding protein [Chelatococcus reniformis]
MLILGRFSYRAGLVALALAISAGAGARESNGIAMHGEPRLQAGFDRLSYAAPDGAGGGRLTLGVPGTFDSLNPFPVKGLTAALGVATLSIDSLMKRSLDEPFTLYGLIARSIETPDDRSYVTFRLDPRAKFSDGVPITADDVKFSLELLRKSGRPNYRNSYAKVSRIEIIDPHTIRFDLSQADDRELPLILGLMPVLPKHATDAAHFDAAGFKPLVGSGPYMVDTVKPGESITYRRDPAYWGAELPVNRGTINFNEIRYDYYRDANSLFEAFKAGLYDVRVEHDPARWTQAYDIPAVNDGRIVKEHPRSLLPKGMSGFVFNTRRAKFTDIRVREALSYLFDFDWVNRNLYYGLYERTSSYFAESPMASTGRPAGPLERKLLAPFPNAVRADIMDGSWRPASADGTGRDREAFQRALTQLEAAGLRLDGSALKQPSGEPLTIEIMVVTREQERLALNLADSLRWIGIATRVRLVDTVQYERRRQRFDYDMIIASWPVSPSPGNEQYFRWGSQSADREASFNFAGARSPAVDAMIAALLAADSAEAFDAAARALDRTLLSGFYVIPLFHLSDFWIARTNRIGRPAQLPLYGPYPEQWWQARDTAPVSR